MLQIDFIQLEPLKPQKISTKSIIENKHLQSESKKLPAGEKKEQFTMLKCEDNKKDWV